MAKKKQSKPSKGLIATLIGVAVVAVVGGGFFRNQWTNIAAAPEPDFKASKETITLEITGPEFSFDLNPYANKPEFLTPKGANELIVKHTGFTLSYSEEHEQAEWVAYKLSKQKLKGDAERDDEKFKPDPKVKSGSAALADYKGSGYDRGHLAPAADMKWSEEAMSDCFYLSNMSPQVAEFNRGIWEQLESQIRSWAYKYGELYIATGPALKMGVSKRIGKNDVSVPKYYYKVIVDLKLPEVKAIAFILENKSSQKPLYTFALSVDKCEELTGIDFLAGLPDDMEGPLEATLDAGRWSWEVQQKPQK